MSVEGAAGMQWGYGGGMAALAFGFAPTRSMTVLVSAEHSYVPTRIKRDEFGSSAERGGTEQFVSGEFRYAFLASRRASPYVLAGTGVGVSRLNVNEFFPNAIRRTVGVFYYGGGVRIPIQKRLDAFADVRLSVAAGAEADYMSVRLPVRAGIAWRF